MRVNAHTAIVGDTVILIPYRWVVPSETRPEDDSASVPEQSMLRSVFPNAAFSRWHFTHSMCARNYGQKYHTWMQSAELRELTASEELTLEQEYAMQRELPHLAPPIKSVANGVMNRKLAGGRGQYVAILIALISQHLTFSFALQSLHLSSSRVR